MRALLIAATAAMLSIAVGCQSNKNSSDYASDTTKMSTAKDDCPMCAGVQKANAAGKCPKCDMKVKG